MSAVWATLYALATAGLVVYGLHAAYLLAAARRRGPAYVARLAACRAASPVGRTEFPRVLVQLPVYNEPRVITRLIEAVCALDWPRAALVVQVLDDSTDETTELARAALTAARAQGVEVQHVRRATRAGFKAGALTHGLTHARAHGLTHARVSCDAPFVAIFDADFVPPPEFLRAALPLFDVGPRVACVQGRWTHLNRAQSALTRAQAVAVDAHFLVQQLARASGAGLLNFNGSAGVWRRAAIEDAGGWSAATLTEDLDLSFRAHLRGWSLVFDPTLTAPGELPPTLAAYKSQQRRWACGSLQCARRLLGPLWRSGATAAGPGLSLRAKLEATLHLFGYCVSVAMVALAALLPLGFGHLLLLQRAPSLWPLWAAVCIAVWAAALGPLRVALHGQRAANGARPALRDVVAAALLGVGAAANNACAALRGLLWPIREFVRTPKQGRGSAARGSLPKTEVGFALWTALAAGLCALDAPVAVALYTVFCSSGYWALALYWWGRERRLPEAA